jgi:hypothetical protein
MRNTLACLLLAAPCIAATSSLAIAQAPFTEAEIAALVQNPAVNAAIAACSGDRWRLCGGVIPGGGRIVRCLAANAESLSPQCRSAMREARDTVYAARGGPPLLPAK